MCRDLLKPLADVTNYLEGDKYSTSSAVVPFIISIEEHLSTTSDNKFSTARKQLLEEFRKCFTAVINPSVENFNPTLLICTMLNPEKSAELSQELFDPSDYSQAPAMQAAASSDVPNL
jgi:hypothetical protein